MYYRALVVGIVLFWLWTTAWLLRTEPLPGESEKSPVPTAFLWKLMFLHQEASDLTLYYHGERLGSLHLQPHHDPQHLDPAGSPVRLLTLSGGFSVETSWAPRQNVVLHGLLELDGQDNARRLELSAAIHEPKRSMPGWTVVLDGQPLADHWHYSIRHGEQVAREKSGTLTELIDVPELRSVGLDPAGLSRFQQQQFAQVSFTAHRDKLHLNGDDIDTYVASMKDANGLETTVHLNQLGQVLAVKTFAGVELLDGALTP